MGIKDLLQSLADAMDKDFALTRLRGRRVAIDASGSNTVLLPQSATFICLLSMNLEDRC